MKKIVQASLSVVVSCVLLANMGATLVAAAPLLPVNLISNPTFLLGGGPNNGPQDWNTAAWGDASGATFTYPVTGQDDNYAAQVKISSYGTAVGGGAAEWYFNPVPVTGNDFYTFSDWYNSDTTSYLVAQFTLSNSANLMNFHLATLPQTNNGWIKTTQQFTVPANATSMTILHLLQSNGSLTVDNYSLLASTAPDSDLFTLGMVSLTFDDGYANQIKYALPTLANAGLKGTFYIIPNPVIQATSEAVNLLTLSGIPTTNVTTNSSTTWGNIINGNGAAIYTDPTNQSYTFSENYTATAASTININYCNIVTVSGDCPLANIISTTIGTLPAATTSTSGSFDFTLPIISGSTTTPISITQSLSATGTLTVSNPSVTGSQTYMTQTDLLALQNAGQEIGSHATDHCDLIQLYNDPNLAMTSVGCPDYALSAPSTAQSQISDSRTLLSNLVPPAPIDSFAYPFGNYTNAIEQLVSGAHYTNARSVDVGYNTKTADPFDLKVQNVDPTTTVAQIKSWIDTAAANKLWLILVFHEIEPQSLLDANGSAYGATPETLQQVATYLQTYNANHTDTITVPTVSEGTALMTAVTPPPPPVTPSVPVASPIAGTYTTAQSVILSSTNSTAIYYTLDGTAPGCLIGNLYAGAISVPSSTDLKAVGCNTGGSSEVGDFNYVITGNGPVVTVPADITVQSTSSNGTAVTFTATATDEFEGSLTPACTPASGSTFPIGVTSVNCVATNSHSQNATGSFNVTVQVVVQDTPKPVIVLNGEATVNLHVGDAYTDAGATATDSTNATITVVAGGDTVTTSSPGIFHITYDATDSTGNHAVQVIRTINVTAPQAVVVASGGGGGGGGGGGSGSSGGSALLSSLSSASHIPGDINKDGKVNILDFGILMTNWGTAPSNTQADVNSDGKVDILDFSILMTNWTV